ncbi:hypothetical protein FACS189491_05300 [Spirochaetia bacterium]|nr:hypothetical protein FACS189491_05300 [Spirochaetia bacterium]
MNYSPPHRVDGIRLGTAEAEQPVGNEETEIQSGSDQKIIVADEKMKNVFNLADKIKDTRATVLLLGESGTGKDIIAQYIHKSSIYRDKPFIAVNCGAFSESLLESELFGFISGTFTGADRKGRQGIFEAAYNGIVFLDEIGDMSPNLQIRLLRTLESKIIMRVGETKPTPVNARILAATNKNLEKLVHTHKFREDLYYRLNVVKIYIPSLRERHDDILPIARHFLQYYNSQYRLKKRLADNILPVFQQYNWPGNIRELKNKIEQLVLTSRDDLIQITDLQLCELSTGQERSFFSGANYSTQPPDDVFVSINKLIPMKQAVEHVERMLLMLAKDKLGTTRSIAQKLNISHATVCRKMHKYNI